MPENKNAILVIEQNVEPASTVKQEQNDSKPPRYTDAEKQNFLADQKVKDWSNEETAEKAGVSEATIRRWQNRMAGKKTPAKKTVKRPKPKARKQPSANGSRSVTKIREQLELANSRIAELEAELAVVKPLAKFYFK